MTDEREPEDPHISAAEMKALLMIAPTIIAAAPEKGRISRKKLAQQHGVDQAQLDAILNSLDKGEYIVLNGQWVVFHESYTPDTLVTIDFEYDRERGFDPFPYIVLVVGDRTTLRQLLAQIDGTEVPAATSEPTPGGQDTAPTAAEEPDFTEEELAAARVLIHAMLEGFHREPPKDNLERALEMLRENMALLKRIERLFGAAFQLFKGVQEENQARCLRLEQAIAAAKEAAAAINI